MTIYIRIAKKNQILSDSYLKLRYFQHLNSKYMFLGSVETCTYVHCDSTCLPRLSVAHKILQSYFYFVSFNGK